MSLNNYLKVDYKLLPIIKNVKPEKFENIEWQSLSIDNWLADYIITENSLLYFDHFNNKTKDVNYHGMIHFYSQESNIKHEFNTKYTDGKLINIVQVINKQDKHWRTR